MTPLDTASPLPVAARSADLQAKTQDRPYQPMSGVAALLTVLAGFAAIFGIVMSGFGTASGRVLWYGLDGTRIALIPTLLILNIILLKGLNTVPPRKAVVLTLFGKYHGTFAKPGLWWFNPLCDAKEVSLATVAEETAPITVNDLSGNPISVAAMITWRVQEAARAHFDVSDYSAFVRLQGEAALRHVASQHPYDRAEIEVAKAAASDASADAAVLERAKSIPALRSDRDAINQELIQELGERTEIAGVVIEEVRITHLAYAPEIAGAMLKRQQAQAIIDARRLMVEGSVGIVRDTLKQLSDNTQTGGDAISFEPEQKATFASNLLIMIVGDREASPVLNVGTFRP